MVVRKDVTVETKDVTVDLQESSGRVCGRRRRRRVGAAVSSAVLAGVLVGCSGVDPGDQREEMLAAAETVAEAVSLVASTEPWTVLDDGTVPVSCASGGSRYQYVAYGWSDQDLGDEVDTRLDRLTGAVSAGVSRTGVGSDLYFDGSEEIGSAAEDGEGPRQVTWRVDEGPDAGSSVTVELVVQEDEAILVRLAGTTACG